MPDLWMDVDTPLAEVPVNSVPLIDDTDFKTIEGAVAYNAAGLALRWHFITVVGTYTVTNVTPTSGGDYDWTDHGDSGIYTIAIPDSGGASINNDTEGFGWFTGSATGILPWKGPTIGFRDANLNALLITSQLNLNRGLAGLALPDAEADAGGGLPVSDNGGLDLDAILDASISSRLADGSVIVGGYDEGQSPGEQVSVDLSSLESSIGGLELSVGDIGEDVLSIISTLEGELSVLVAGYGDGQSPADLVDLSGLSTHSAGDVVSELGDGSSLTALALQAKMIAYFQLLARNDAAIITDLSAEIDELNHDYGSGTGSYSPASHSLKALEDAIGNIEGGGGGGSSSPELLQETTIASLSSQTSFTLTEGSADNDAYNGCMLIVTDQSTATQKSRVLISDYVGSTRTVTLAAAPAFTIATGDDIAILATPAQLPVALPSASGGLVTGDANNRIAGIQGTITTLDALDTAQDSQHSTTQGTLTTILGDTNELQTDWVNGGRLDLLLDAIKAVTDNLPNGGSLNDLATLVSRITASRAGYLDNLNVGGLVASSSEATAIQNNTRVVRVVPEAIMRPATGTTTYRIELLLYDAVGNMEAPDSAPTIALVNQAGTDRSSRLDSTTMTLVSTGRYRAIYTSTDTDAVEQLVWTFSVVEGGNTRLYGNHSQVTDVLGVDFTSADRAKLDELHDNRLTSDRAGYLDKLNVSGTLAHSDDASTYQADISGIESTLGIPASLEGGNNIADNLVDIYNRAGEIANAQQDTDSLIQQRSSLSGFVTDDVEATTTTFSTDLGGFLDDAPNGRWRITFLFSTAFGLGISRLITDFAADDGVLTVSPALPEVPSPGDSFVIEPVEVVLGSDYDAAKTAAQAGDAMDLVDSPNTTAIEALATEVSVQLGEQQLLATATLNAGNTGWITVDEPTGAMAVSNYFNGCLLRITDVSTGFRQLRWIWSHFLSSGDAGFNPDVPFTFTPVAGDTIEIFATERWGTNVTHAGDVQWASGAITAASIAANAIGASEIATDAINEIRDAVLVGLDSALTALQEAADAIQAVTDLLPDDGALTDLGTLADRLTSERANYLDKLNVSGTLAHSDAAATYRADVSDLATAASISALATSAEIAALELHGDENWGGSADLEGLATQESLDAVAANVSTLLTRIPSALFSGITSLAGWLRLLFRSDAAATTDYAASLTEINASGGSGAGDYANQTASLEATGTVAQKLDTTLELSGGSYVFTVASLANGPSGEISVGEEIWNVAWAEAPAAGDPENWSLLEALGMLVRREYARNQQDNVVGEVRTYDWDGTTVICRQDATAANGVSTLDQAETPE